MFSSLYLAGGMWPRLEVLQEKKPRLSVCETNTKAATPWPTAGTELEQPEGLEVLIRGAGLKPEKCG